MCDTFTAMPNSTINNSLLFAKNSDREPNEPHIIVRIPARNYKKGTTLKCTYIEIEQVENTFDVMLFKPSWIWGAEMGINEYGVVIGNEAVFTKEKQGPPKLTGMDILRLNLERCKTADDAANYTTYLLEKYSQGGNCGYTEKLKYDNSFLIADFDSAYVVETAGKHWAIEKIHDVRSISNTLTIKSGALKYSSDIPASKGNINFKKIYDNRIYSYFSCGNTRHMRTESLLKKNSGNIDAKYMMEILRQHDDKNNKSPFERGSMNDICMHAGGIISSQTTGSMVAELNEGRITIWATGSSLPCVSIFKPLWFTENYDNYFDESNKNQQISHWRKREQLRRMILDGKVNSSPYIAEKSSIEEELYKRALKCVSDDDKNELTEYAFKMEDNLIDRIMSTGSKNNSSIKGNIYFKNYWKSQNRKFYI